MILAWQTYVSDTQSHYPLLSAGLERNGRFNDKTNAIGLLPPVISSLAVSVKDVCSVPNLVPRSIWLVDSNERHYTFVYPRPFSQNLHDYLTYSIHVQAFELIGERIKYSRLRSMTSL